MESIYEQLPVEILSSFENTFYYTGMQELINLWAPEPNHRFVQYRKTNRAFIKEYAEELVPMKG